VPPLKVALWAYHINDPECELRKTIEDTTLTLERGDLAHHWTTGLTQPGTDGSYDQTRAIFEHYDDVLASRRMTLFDNAVRTWIYVKDVDANYMGMVDARREFFAEQGLTPDTHFVASTGIEGAYAELKACVTMDAYAIGGLQPGQVEFLSALDHLSHTHVYGVTFERATSVAYRDRKHILISGTASIDRDGEILFPGDVMRQLDRTIENMEALLKQRGATLRDMCVFTVYVRDPSDHQVAWQHMRERFGDAPIEVVVAPVCRPGWLIEAEGHAVVPASNPDLPVF
jgi:enamine deaminase RidA (YjgF/YER057c/UK114 family)